MPSVFWTRRDLRLRDNDALHTAAADGPVLVLFVLDDALIRPAGAVRVAMLVRTLRALDESLRRRGGLLTVRRGDPVTVVPQVATEVGASAVHAAADHGPYGARRDAAVAAALGTVPLIRTGSPYAVEPGRLRKSDGTAYRVFTPYYRAWLGHGWQAPIGAPPHDVDWLRADCEQLPPEPRLPPGLVLPDTGEDVALAAWHAFRDGALAEYGERRDRPDLAGTSRLSVHLKWGCIHPRRLLAEMGPHHEAFRRELAWREFYAAVLADRPETAREYATPKLAAMVYEPADSPAFDAWCTGRTGYPIVDAGMRQLLGEAWMHNRVRMIVASFLVKDLHIEWTHGARHFMRHLADGDLASNQHGWQWTAGTGTDAAPFFRVFNPVAQGHKFDPNGDYVRQWVPELRGVPGPAVHEPWLLRGGVPAGYPEPIVDHAHERAEALDRYRAAR